MDLSEKAWDNRYKMNDIGWDLGEVSPPLKAYFNQLENKNLKILIPGGGNSYEAEYLFKKGFTNVSVVDLSETALQNIQERAPNFPKHQLILGDFFDTDETYDLIIEQTFFCAIHPELRQNYATKMHSILKPQGKLVGVLFNVPLFSNRPPFGSNAKEYKGYFKPYFYLNVFEPCYNSIHSRKGRELFINFEKK